MGGEKLLAFGTRGDESYLFRPSDVYGAWLPAAYERRTARESPYFLNEYISWLLAIPVFAMVLGWPALLGLGVFLRRRRGDERRAMEPLPLAVTLSATAAVVLFAWFALGFVARSNRMFQTGEMFFGMPDSLAGMSWIPFAHVALSGILAVALPTVWRRRWWDLPRRVVYSTVLVSLGLQVAFLRTWNYLPAVW